MFVLIKQEMLNQTIRRTCCQMILQIQNTFGKKWMATVNSPPKLTSKIILLVTPPLWLMPLSSTSSVWKRCPSDFCYSNPVNSVVANSSFLFATILPIEVQQSFFLIKYRSGGLDGLDVKFIKVTSNVLAGCTHNVTYLAYLFPVPVMWKWAKLFYRKRLIWLITTFSLINT